MSTPTDLVPDTSDMVVIHRVFRREFGRLPGLVAAVRAGDTARATMISEFAGELVSGLHHHHTNEDELLWPRLRDRAELDRKLVERMERQHDVLAELLGTARTLLDGWVAAADVPTRDRLVGVLTQVAARLDEHLSEEESEVLPVVRRCITTTEWAELGERGMASIPPRRRLVFLGHILEETSAEERRAFLASVPAPGRLLYKLVGERRYRKEMAQLIAG